MKIVRKILLLSIAILVFGLFEESCLAGELLKNSKKEDICCINPLFNKNIRLSIFYEPELIKTTLEKETSEEETTVEKVETSGEETTMEKVETSREIEVEDIDIGDYQTSMVIGEKQLLVVTVLPLGAANTEVYFSSSNDDIATINSMGRITALKPGKTTITVKCSKKKVSFVLVVQNEILETEERINVKDIEISDYKDELFIGDTISLSASVVPTNATDNTVYYKSSDKSIATVNSSGEVICKGKGVVTISISAGNITKHIKLRVSVKTIAIKAESQFMVLQVGEKRKLEASVIPSDASQSLSYKSTNNIVAEISSKGVLTAKDEGNASIIISNGDMSIAVSVIVNKKNIYDDDRLESEDEIGQNYRDTKYETVLDANEISMVTKEMLQYYYDNSSKVTINGHDYIIELDGSKIVNYNNAMHTDIDLHEEDDETVFVLNQGEKMCGEVTLKLSNVKGKYLYLFNETKSRYELVDIENVNELSLTTSGKYLITNHKKNAVTFFLYWATITSLIVTFVGSIIYIVLRKQYLFW